MTPCLFVPFCQTWLQGTPGPLVLDKLPFHVTSGKGIRFEINVQGVGRHYLADLRMVNDGNVDVRVPAFNSSNFRVECVATDPRGRSKYYYVGARSNSFVANLEEAEMVRLEPANVLEAQFRFDLPRAAPGSHWTFQASIFRAINVTNSQRFFEAASPLVQLRNKFDRTPRNGPVKSQKMLYRRKNLRTTRIAIGPKFGARVTEISRATFAAPSTPGTYAFQWRPFEQGVEFFGAPSTSAPIQVT